MDKLYGCDCLLSQVPTEGIQNRQVSWQVKGQSADGTSTLGNEVQRTDQEEEEKKGGGLGKQHGSVGGYINFYPFCQHLV